jgi:hypothetical protein
MEEDVIGGRESLGAGDGERENFHRSARALPAAADTPGISSPPTAPQVTALIQDFAVSLGWSRGMCLLRERGERRGGQRDPAFAAGCVL